MRRVVFAVSLIAFLVVVAMVATGVRSEWHRHQREQQILTHAFQANLVSSGNATCPVSGDEARDEFYVDHDGKRIGLCCPHCKEYFLAEPDKYL